MKIEKDQAFPSSVIVNQMAKAIDSNFAQGLIFSHCRNQYQSFDYLFKDAKVNHENAVSEPNTSLVAQGQRELSKREILMLADKQENYFLFLLLTLSRGAVHIDELRKYHGIEKSIEVLVEYGIAISENDFVTSTSSEFRFPVDKDRDINQSYATFDAWDTEFSHQFEFERLINKMMIRRISPRYLNAIKKQIDTISDFVRLSDEADQKHNNDVLHLQIQLSRGEIPG